MLPKRRGLQAGKGATYLITRPFPTAPQNLETASRRCVVNKLRSVVARSSVLDRKAVHSQPDKCTNGLDREQRFNTLYNNGLIFTLNWTVQWHDSDIPNVRTNSEAARKRYIDTSRHGSGQLDVIGRGLWRRWRSHRRHQWRKLNTQCAMEAPADERQGGGGHWHFQRSKLWH